MLRKRELIVQVRKKNTPEDEAISEEMESLGEKFIELLPKILIGGVVAVYGYVLLDTVRQVTVAQYNQ